MSENGLGNKGEEPEKPPKKNAPENERKETNGGYTPIDEKTAKKIRLITGAVLIVALVVYLLVRK